MLCFLSTGCEKEEVKQEQLLENEVESATFLRKEIGRQEIESNSKITKEFSKIASNTLKKSRERYIHIDNSNLIMIVDKATYIEKGKYNSYTFPTLQGKDEKIRNILFNKNEQGNYDAYLMEYNYSWNEFTDADITELPGEFTMSSLNLNIDALNHKQMASRWVCVYEYSWTPDQGQLVGVGNSDLEGWVLIATVCHAVYYEVVGSNYSPTYTSSYTTNGETATYTGTSTIATSPTNDPLLDEEYLHALNVVKSELGAMLHLREQNYLDRQLVVTMQNYWFLEKNKFSEEAKYFSAAAVSASLYGGDVDFEDPIDDYDFTEESTEILAFEQDYRNQMKNTEKAIFDNLSRLQQLDYLHSAFLAREYSQIYFENSIKVQYNGKGDAYRHTLWNALGAAKLGETLMEQLTNAHEVPDIGEPANPLLEKSMDLHNNSVGRNIGNQSSFMLMMKVKFAVDKGETKYLNPTNQDGTIIPNITVLKNTNE